MEEYVPEFDEAEEQAAYELDMQMQYERKPCDVQCGICLIMDTAAEMTLRSKGWSLSRAGEYCPAH